MLGHTLAAATPTLQLWLPTLKPHIDSKASHSCPGQVFLGAAAVHSNGTVMARIGSASVAMAADARGVPVIICCETYKFVAKVRRRLVEPAAPPCKAFARRRLTVALQLWRSTEGHLMTDHQLVLSFMPQVQLDSITSNELGDPGALTAVAGRPDITTLADWQSQPNLGAAA